MSNTIVLKPRLNEKTYGLAAGRVYVFDVDRSVNKHSIARAVESQFEVKVAAVKTANVRGKAKRTMSLSGKRYANSEGRRNDFKKAYVTLAEGNALPFFDAIEEEEQKEHAAQEQFDKAAAKQADKESKATKKTAKAETPAKSEDKAAGKPVPAKKPAVKSATKKTPAGKTGPAETETAEPAATAEEPETKHGLAAWRGFRLRKKNKGNK